LGDIQMEEGMEVNEREAAAAKLQAQREHTEKV
jgi:hypothetical protein